MWQWSIPLLRFVWLTAKAKMGWGLFISVLWKKAAILGGLKYAKLRHEGFFIRQKRKIAVIFWKSKRVFNKHKKIILTSGGIAGFILFLLIFIFPEFAVTIVLKTAGSKLLDLLILFFDTIWGYILAFGGQIVIDIFLTIFFFIFDPIMITLLVIIEIITRIICRHFEFCKKFKESLKEKRENRQKSLGKSIDKLKK